MSAVVSDTSPLHYLVECEAIEILPALFQEILIPPTVHRELQHQKTPSRVRAWAQSLPGWVKVQAPAVLDDVPSADRQFGSGLVPTGYAGISPLSFLDDGLPPFRTYSPRIGFGCP